MIRRDLVSETRQRRPHERVREAAGPVRTSRIGTTAASVSLSAVGVTVPFIFVSRAMFPTASEPMSLEDHYMAQRKVLLVALTVPPCVSAISNILGGNLYSGWPGVWMACRIAAPLLLIPFNSRTVQRIGLTLFAALLVLGMFRW